MKRKGIELKEITTPQVFDPPKPMFVWDNDVKCDVLPVQTVYAVIRTVSGTTQVVGAGSLRWAHCAEIPEEPKPRRATNRELSKWISQYGEWTYEYDDAKTVYHEFSYKEPDRENLVVEKIYIRRWDDTDWHEPTVDYMGIEDNLAFDHNVTSQWIEIPEQWCRKMLYFTEPNYFKDTEVKIGNQVWMNKNLNVGDGGEGIYFNKVNGEYYYTWEAAKRIADKIPGWHLPSLEEWNELVEAAGNYAANLRVESWKGTNKYGFSTVPAGYWDTKFNNVGSNAYFWTSEPYGSYAWSRSIDTETRVLDYYYNQCYGFSVRLVKDK